MSDERPRPAVIGHRGASGYRPENTLASYELAARMGADRIEPDLVPTCDGVLVLRHESELSRSTDIASRDDLAGRVTTRLVDGKPVTGWFTEDLTLDEVRSLRAREPAPDVRQETTVYDGLYPVPTFTELLDLATSLSCELGREIIVSAEVKEPSRFEPLGLDVAGMVLAALDAADLDAPNSPVAVQCFEPAFLRRLRSEGLPVTLVQLVADDALGAPLVTPWGLREVSTYAEILAPCKDMILPVDDQGRLGPVSPLLGGAHGAGLDVHVWTLRNENVHLPASLQVSGGPGTWGAALVEHLAFLDAGVDGIFTDHPDTGVEARRLWTHGITAIPRPARRAARTSHDQASGRA